MIAAIGVDLGATNIKLALVGVKGELWGLLRFFTPEHGKVEPVVELLASAILALQQEAERRGDDAAGVGVGVAGWTDAERGIVRGAPNMEGWMDVPLRALLEERVKLPVFVDNDANAAAYAEAWVGAGKGCRSLVVLTLGTGIGGGLVLEGKIWRGSSGMAAEIGHMIVEPEGERCGCGGRGCLEAYASATAVVREARRIIASGNASGALAGFAGRLETLTAKEVAEAAKAGDAAAARVFSIAGRYLGIALINLINILSPELIVIGGGMAPAGELILGPARAEVKRRLPTPLAEATRIILSPLQEEAGALGAAGLALEQFGHYHEGSVQPETSSQGRTER